MKWQSLEQVKQNLNEFLTDYAKTFNKTNLNPSCDNCLKDYLSDFKNLNKMENPQTNYKLFAK